MSQQRYSSGTLVGNWFEHRFNPVHSAVQSPELKEMRDKNDSITCFGAHGWPKPLNAIKRFKKGDTQRVLHGDGEFRESTTTKDTMVNPNTFENKPLGIMNNNGNTHPLLPQRNALLLRETYRTDKWLGYNFVDSSAPKEEEKRYFETSYSSAMDSHVYALKRKNNTEFDLALTTNQQFYKVPEPDLADTNSPVHKKLQKQTKRNVLAAEILRTSFDPQHDTRMQRLWVSGGDPGIEAKLKFGDRLDQEYDSLSTVGSGNISDKNHCRKVRSEITNVPVFHHTLSLR